MSDQNDKATHNAAMIGCVGTLLASIIGALIAVFGPSLIQPKSSNNSPTTNKSPSVTESKSGDAADQLQLIDKKLSESRDGKKVTLTYSYIFKNNGDQNLSCSLNFDGKLVSKTTGKILSSCSDKRDNFILRPKRYDYPARVNGELLCQADDYEVKWDVLRSCNFAKF